MIKVLCFIDSLGSGGAQKQLTNLSIYLSRNGFNVTFLVYHQNDFFKNGLIIEGIEVHEVIEKNYIKRLFKIRKFIISNSFDVVISFLEACNFITSFTKITSKKKFGLILGERNSNPEIISSTRLKLLRVLNSTANYIVSNSYENMNYAKKATMFSKSTRFEVIYNSLNLDYWDCQKKLSFKNNPKCKFLVAASHVYRKNARGLIEALNLLDDIQKYKIEVNWFGDEKDDMSYSQNKKLIDIYKLNEVIKFLPATKDIKGKIEESDAVILVSFNEGIPNIICESLAMGKPVIVSAISDLPIILKSSKNLLVDPKDSKEIRDAIVEVSNWTKNKKELITKENREIAAHLFDEYLNSQKYVQLIQNMNR